MRGLVAQISAFGFMGMLALHRAGLLRCHGPVFAFDIRGSARAKKRKEPSPLETLQQGTLQMQPKCR